MEPDSSPVESSRGKTDTAHGKLFTAFLDRNFASNAQSSPEGKNATSALRRAHTVAQGRNVGEKAKVGSKTARERIATSFLRVKDSHELLRKRSSKRLDAPSPPRDTHAGAREPNHFTVANVGQNGKIFLRPIRNPSLKESCPQPFALPADQSKGEHIHSRRRDGLGVDEPSRWSNSQLSELRPELIPEETCDDHSIKTESTQSVQYPSLRHPRLRTRSFSTISEQGSTFRAGANGEFRIFIDRLDDRPKSADGSLRPTLGTSIPHYSLDFPHYSARGSTPLYRSIYSRTSLSDNFLAARFLSEDLSTGPISDVYLGQPGRPSFAASMFSGTPAIELTRGSTATDKPVLYELKGPIEPSIFEKLALEMYDDRVVRYAPGTKDISAATPARIVAQISSESFMDYELVSDFFLTFRSYLSTDTLLALLLARLQWAINRLQDDGRIIRIRTFAALRHWILNYFVDDFIPNYGLRTRFCETINRMYDNVKAREGGGTSDLKILIDLKRCWYGRCSVYWDFQDQHIAYHTPDYHIVPGGDDQPATGCGESHLRRVRTTSTQEGDRRARTPHVRNDSSATAKSMPVSVDSDGSVHVTSCSLPPKSPKRLSMSIIDTKAPHPVPLVPLKPVGSLQEPLTSSPVASKRIPFRSHAHKRSGSFSDSARDGRAPLSLLKLDTQGSVSTQEALNLGSLIRGELYAPVESYMTMMAPPSPPLPASSGTDRRSQPEDMPKPAASGSGVKTIIGSIRRALNSRNGGQSTSLRNTNGPFAPPTRGKTSALPTNIAFGSDSYRDRKTATAAKKPTRIDVLCDKSLQQYHRTLAGYSDTKEGSPAQEVDTSRVRQSWLASGSDIEEADNRVLLPDRGRFKSQLTGGSKSIVIVDDTGLRNPVMSGAIGLEQPPGFLNRENPPTTPRAGSLYPQSQRSTLAGGEYSLPIYFDDTDLRSLGRDSQFLRPPRLFASQRSSSVGRGSSSWKRTSPSLRLRKYASFQSGISRQRLAVVAEPDLSAMDRSSQGNFDKPAGPTLRRRPGGDLRQMRDGLGSSLRSGPASFISSTTYRTSTADSTATDAYSRPQTHLIPPNPRFSLLQTHSSQNLRHSFEAAIAQFAQIPDDDDGGVESALMKLEGKWRGTSTDIGAGPSESPHNTQVQGNIREQELFCHSSAVQNVRRGLDPGVHRRQTFVSENLTYSHFRGMSVPRRPYSESLAESEDSYSSIPLLERGLSDESMKKPALSRTSSRQTVPGQIQPSDASSKYTWDTESSHPSFHLVKETESIKRIPRGSTFPVPQSFNHRLSGLSEDSTDLGYSQEASEQQRLSLYTDSVGRSSLGIPRHPLAHPPTPPMTIPHPRSVTSCASPLNPALFQAPPLTPDPSPSRNMESGHVRAIDTQHVSGDVLSRSEWDRSCQAPEPDHIPFILSCESQILAQQLTIIEMAALSEIDWRDLVDMRWSSGSPSSLSWVQFLMEEERRGIDLVVGRFNLMVKWVLSEIVLTRNIHERARTITKFIHTAAHARRFCNYATMLQIAIALSSTDCSRLQKTWNLVLPGDRDLLKDMEVLIQPVRNFHDLRVEMETANVQEGCIPFVGLYVHDLTYNSQKPAQVAAHDGEPLINFERYRTTAKIVKSLLRLIDAGTKYNFVPVHGIVERCLWIASLSEEQIQTYSKQLE